MKLARFWTRQAGEALDRNGRRIRVSSRGWSNDSVDSAAVMARDLAHRAAERVASGQPKSNRYGYGDRPLPEPVVREFQDSRETPNAVVTRNAYGALVMNARDMMFVDIDRQDSPVTTSGGNLLSGLFSFFGGGKAVPSAPSETVVAGLHRVAERNNLTVRVYQTAAGYRVLVLSAPFQPGSGQSEALLREFDSDALYIRLCKIQESFRARLTPKPWRCGLPNPPVSFPFETSEAESQFMAWEAKYRTACAKFASCRFVGSFGGGAAVPGFEELVRYHDLESRAGSGLPLA